MPAHSDKFPWPPYYGHFQFFEKGLKNHKLVKYITAVGSGEYILTKTDDKNLKIFICECYSFGVAEYVETTRLLANIDIIVINSNWCGYTLDAKRYARDSCVGLFSIKDFMAALYKENNWEYLNKNERKLFTDKGWL